MEKLRMILRALIICLLVWSNPGLIHSRSYSNSPLTFNKLVAYDDLPSEEIRQIMIDSQGYIWIATHGGVSRYDGYRIRTYKDNFQIPDILTDNKIKCLAEDQTHKLWIGTANGLNVMDLMTGQIEKIHHASFYNNDISSIYVTHDNHIWIACESEFIRYDQQADRFISYTKSPEGVKVESVKTMLEDSQGRFWIGTWGNGLFRYDPEKDEFRSYPAVNDRNSVHVLFEDSNETIWFGSWDRGLYKLINPESPETIRWERYQHRENDPESLSDNMVYCMEEDVINNTLWIGTRNGLSLLDLSSDKASFVNYLPEKSELKLPYNELNSLVLDQTGNMWLGTVGGGVYSVHLNATPFENHKLDNIKQKVFSNSIRSLFVDDDYTIWLGIGSHGLAIQDKTMREPVFYTDYPSFPVDLKLHTVNDIIQRKSTGELWFAIAGYGVIVYDKKARQKKTIHYDVSKVDWLPDDFVISLLEDRRGNVWIGGRSALSVLKTDGSHITFPVHQNCNSIMESSAGEIWIGTTGGIARFRGNIQEGEDHQLDWFTMDNGRLGCKNIECLFEDCRGNVLAGSDGGGLNLFERHNNLFTQVNNRYNILADGVYGMEEDDQGNLWIATNTAGLIKIVRDPDTGEVYSHSYSESDGLQNNHFLRKASYKAPDGKLFFGGHNGYNSFYPEQLERREVVSPVVITDITVFNHSITEMNQAESKRISDKSPAYTDKIVLDYKSNHFSLEFSVLSFSNPSRHKYAYRLEGYDTEWQYTGASNRMANYNNLKSGSYVFHVKGGNENGLWNEQERSLQVVILPPPWRTTWAYVLYVLLGIFLLYLTYRIILYRLQHKRLHELRLLEQAKAEEVNHAKLQFFTNITHEFLTPLTIISASMEEMKMTDSTGGNTFRIMSDNISRLFRLLQQILEFRKAETGNLKLKVSEGDIIAFIKKEVDAFWPLMKKKQLKFSYTSDWNERIVWFDPDKLDKILYNLLSNASKYNKEGGEISVMVSAGDDENQVRIAVRDNGQGIKPEAIRNLFKRFYEGDYRRFKTTGTGIGLSLTKDLVTLHGGTITVESEEGKGACFIVTLPVTKESFTEDQIDDTHFVPFEVMEAELSETVEAPAADQEESKGYNILLVEDNESLLQLMRRLLGREYTVFEATNGKEALPILEKEELDLVVSDIMMPEMDGVELCVYIKNKLEYSHIPVLLLTAKNREEDRIDAYNSGADGYITKPFNLSLLHARIRNLLKKRERSVRDFKNQLVFEVKEMEFTSVDEDFLERAIQCVHKYMANPDFDQQQFIEEMATSKSTLYKKLKSLTGLNTSGFIRNIRLKAACKLMEERGPSVRVSELAYAVGFNDPKYFSASFKKEFGMLPSEYMEQYTIRN